MYLIRMYILLLLVLDYSVVEELYWLANLQSSCSITESKVLKSPTIIVVDCFSFVSVLPSYVFGLCC